MKTSHNTTACRTCVTASCRSGEHGTRRACSHRECSRPAGSLVASLPAEAESSWLVRNPWIWFWVVFIFLISLWTAFITVAVHNQPASVPVATHE